MIWFRIACVCVCVLWMPFWNINNDSKFVFNSFLIYVHVQPHSCVQYVHMGGYFEVKCFPDKQKNRPRTRKKNIIANSAKKIHYQIEIVRQRTTETEQREKYAIYANFQQILNANANQFRQELNENQNKELKSSSRMVITNKEMNLFSWKRNGELVPQYNRIDRMDLNLCWIQNKCKFLNQSIQMKWTVNQKKRKTHRERNEVDRKSLWSAWSENENPNNRET